MEFLSPPNVWQFVREQKYSRKSNKAQVCVHGRLKTGTVLTECQIPFLPNLTRPYYCPSSHFDLLQASCNIILKITGILITLPLQFQ